jgi:8-oxo-dGTP diphosphatase
MSLEPDYAWPEDWKPVERATLLFVIKDGQILLIEKKRGLGAGKINGPGGRLDPGETPEQCAIREVQEELCIMPTGVAFAGELLFQFVGDNKLGGHSIHGYVYTATDFIGTPTETNEAKPRWTPLDAIPYARMWQDDALWLPQMIEGKKFLGKFVFDEDTMLWHEVTYP